ncbi:T9SS type A sorting domain-containing protein [Hymenobacter cellulosilyticus]|uniref:T9SS type A sorting domain-containing protein n=1 Tax=Hymenobacter cellulosilyticus TaxID=2932248 RepID=A0A8T9Q4E7_9BACT|nr:T9SS type A sorting domain-containing protein [Hymenobacter cellulosilyticus]UOQ72454.1 T9SS type A sorting domain-containing protein [Hymenobacter cellulosilyticus]
MKKTVLIRILSVLITGLFAAQAAQAQAPAWQMAMGTGAIRSEVRATTSDASGNIYISGTYYGSATFGNITLTGNGISSAYLFVAKWSTVSNSFVWAQKAGGTGYAEVNTIAVNGNSVYIAGRFGGTVQFGNTDLVNPNRNTTWQGADAFIAKLTDTGTAAQFEWAQYAGGPSEDVATALAVRGTDVYMAGYYSSDYQGTTPILFGGITLGKRGRRNIFLTKLTDAGSTCSFAWAQRAGGYDTDVASALAVSGTSIYMAGTLTSTEVDFGNQNVAVPSRSMFITKFTDTGSGGNFGWVQQAKGFVRASAMTVVGANVYVVGQFSGTANFDNLSMTSRASGSPSITTSDVFVTKLTDTGSSAGFIWAKQAGSSSDDEATRVVVAGSNVYVGGTFDAYGSTASFGSTVLTSAGGTDLFVAKLIDSGSSADYSWAQRGGGVGDDSLLGLALVGTNVYAAGAIYDRATFGSQTVISPAIGLVGYLAALQDNTITATAPATARPELSLWPNPARTSVRVPEATAATTLTLLDATGRTVRTASGTVLPVQGVAPGLYVLQATTPGQPLRTARLVVE